MPGGFSPGGGAPMRLRGAPPAMMNIYTHRATRKRPLYYSIDTTRQRVLQKIVHQEIKEEEAYKDMEFTLSNENDKVSIRLTDLYLRFQRIQEIRDCYTSPAQSVLSQTILTITLPFIFYFLIFMTIVEVDLFKV